MSKLFIGKRKRQIFWDGEGVVHVDSEHWLVIDLVFIQAACQWCVQVLGKDIRMGWVHVPWVSMVLSFLASCMGRRCSSFLCWLFSTAVHILAQCLNGKLTILWLVGYTIFYLCRMPSNIGGSECMWERKLTFCRKE